MTKLTHSFELPLEFYIQVPPAEIAEIFKSACYDCHSNHTNYPWYSQVAPPSLIISYHVKKARNHLNFSEWHEIDGKHRNHMIEEMIYEINEKDMPQFPYAVFHPKADLTDEQREMLDDYLSDLMYE